MGAACCVAVKHRTITNGPPGETQLRNTRHSPSWSFRWDNRGRVAGEETSEDCVRYQGVVNDRMEVKSGSTMATAFASEEVSPLDSFRSLTWAKSPVSEGNAMALRPPNSGMGRFMRSLQDEGVLRFQRNLVAYDNDQAFSRHQIEVKGTTCSPSVSYSSPVKLSTSAPSVSSTPTSPPPSQHFLLPPNSTPSRWNHPSPGHRLFRQVSDSRIPEYRSPTFSISEEPTSFQPPASANESTWGSNGGSSDSWSIPGFSELLTTRRERWSFDSENSGFSRDKITRSSTLGSPSFDLQTCGVCAKLLSQRASWLSSQISNNEVPVVSVLTCGHVYHSECLEYVTPAINKYDPACPACTFGEKRAVKMSVKALKAELDSKARKRSKKLLVNSDVKNDIVFGDQRRIGVDGERPKMNSSSSMKSSLGKPFLRRHFSFGSKASRSESENQSNRRKGLFWARSSKE